MVWRRSHGHAFRRDEFAATFQQISGHRISGYQLAAGGDSEILSAESKFEWEDGCSAAPAARQVTVSPPGKATGRNPIATMTPFIGDDTNFACALG